LQQIDAIRRTLRSAGWPVSIQGSKRINFKVAFAPAISVGYESDAEYCDVDLSTRLDVAKAKRMAIDGAGTKFDKAVVDAFLSLS
jgi:uncharacterized protein (DUF2344 family)